MATSPLALSTGVSRPERVAELSAVATTFCLCLCALTAPHSIAAVQGSFVLAAVFWLVRVAVVRRWELPKTPADVPVLIFLGLCLLSSIFSYVPKLSLDGMRGVAFLGAVYLIGGQVRNLLWVVALTLTLFLSCQVNCVFTLLQRIQGDGIRVTDFQEHSPFPRAEILPGDVILTADGQAVRDLETLSRMADAGDPASFINLRIRRSEEIFETQLRRGAVTKAGAERGRREKKGAGKSETAALQGVERFGAKCSTAHDFRAKGFYNHYATYAEVLQLIASLGVGLWVCLGGRGGSAETGNSTQPDAPLGVSRRGWRIVIGIAVLLTLGALACTLTRAPVFGFGVSVFVMLAACWRVGRLPTRAMIALVVLAGAVSVSGVAWAYKQRGISATDTSEGSTFWRLVVWQEGVRLIEKHPLLGIGKNSDKVFGKEWGLWDNGRLPPGHFHNTYLQVAVWWGLPALVAYVWMMWSFGLSRWRLFVSKPFKSDDFQHLVAAGLVLGTLGGLAGFAVSSVVHFNFGDGEVAMVLWLLVGLSIASARTVERVRAEG